MDITDEEIEAALNSWFSLPLTDPDDYKKRMRAAILASRAARPHLFVEGAFTAHSGGTLFYKIDCDALTDADIETLAREIVCQTPPFSVVEGVPRGGLRLAASLEKYRATTGGLLIVDDVLTTGASMEVQRAGRDARGVVIFARGPWPAWVTPLFCTPRAHIAALRARCTRDMSEVEIEEVVARAIYDVAPIGERPWEDAPAATREDCIVCARAALTDAEIEAVRSALHGLFVELDIGDFAAKSWARAAILAYRTALRVHGLKIVAREPTEAMTEIGIDIWCNLPGTDDHQGDFNDEKAAIT